MKRIALLLALAVGLAATSAARSQQPTKVPATKPAPSVSDTVSLKPSPELQKALDDLAAAVQALALKIASDPQIKAAAMQVASGAVTTAQQVVAEQSVAIQEALKDALALENAPKRIECFDISHIQGTDKVASMVVWENGRMKKSDYRKFIIRTVEGNDDFAADLKHVPVWAFHGSADKAVSPAEEKRMVDAVNRYAGLDHTLAPTLFYEFHGSERSVAEQSEQVGAIAALHGGTEFRWATRQDERESADCDHYEAAH